ncbi:MAG: hypothetical protein ABSE48_18395, partial [Verrucomicrobiota bacterium]
MKTPKSKEKDWPRKITIGRESVTIYKRKMPNGEPGFLVANYADHHANGKRKRQLDSYATETDAVDAATTLARKLSKMDVLAAQMTNSQASEYAASVQKLEPFGVGLLSTIDATVEALKFVKDLQNLIAAAKSYVAKNKQIIPKKVSDVVKELIEIKKARGSSPRYIEDLKSRGNRIGQAFQKNIGDVRTSD